MNQVCIYSDVDCRYAVMEFDELLRIDETLNLYNSEDFKLLQIERVYLDQLKTKIANIVNLLLQQRNIQRVSSKNDEHLARFTIRADWIGENIQLYLKSKTDVHLSTLITFYEMILNTIKINGNVFLFRRNLLLSNYVDNIIASLRVRGGLSLENLLNTISRFDDGPPQKNVDMHSLEVGLNVLLEIGAIFYDSIQDVYLLTSRGYLFQ